MRLLLTIAALLQLSAAIAQHVQYPPKPTPVVPQTAQPVVTAPIRCKEVVDGDTLVLTDGRKIRLIGVDTPETVDPRKPVQVFGKEASDFTKRIATGKDLRLEYDQEQTDKYGRTLAYVYLPDGRMLNGEIIKNGYGFAYTKYPFKYMDLFRNCERHARIAQVGLWSPTVQAQIPDAAAVETLETATPNGTVYITAKGKKFHLQTCNTLGKNLQAVTKAQATSQGLTPCSLCNP